MAMLQGGGNPIRVELPWAICPHCRREIKVFMPELGMFAGQMIFDNHTVAAGSAEPCRGAGRPA